MENAHIFKVMLMPQTNTLPSRIRIRSLRLKQTVYISRGDNDHWYEEAGEYLANEGFVLLNLCEGEYGDMYIVSSTFKDLN